MRLLFATRCDLLGLTILHHLLRLQFGLIIDEALLLAIAIWVAGHHHAHWCLLLVRWGSEHDWIRCSRLLLLPMMLLLLLGLVPVIDTWAEASLARHKAVLGLTGPHEVVVLRRRVPLVDRIGLRDAKRAEDVAILPFVSVEVLKEVFAFQHPAVVATLSVIVGRSLLQSLLFASLRCWYL